MTRAALGALGLALVFVFAGPAAAEDDEAGDQARNGDPQADAAAPQKEELLRQVKAGIRVFRRCGDAVVGVTVTTHAIPLPRIELRGVTQISMGALAEEHDGTGFLADDQGHIVTLAALVTRAAEIRVRFADGRTGPARLIGQIPAMGIAVLHAVVPDDAKPLVMTAPATDSKAPLAWVLSALGEPGEPEITPVSVEASEDFGGWYDRFMQAEHDLADGAGGSPLVDAEGRLLGMAVGKSSGFDPQTGKPHPITFFVQGSDIADAVRTARETGRIDRPMLGVLPLDRSGTIDFVVPGGPAEKAGLQAGDVLLAIDDYPIETAACITRSLLRHAVGTQVAVRVRRGDEEFVRSLELAPARAPEPVSTPPLPGATLELSAVPLPDGRHDVAVLIREVKAGSVLAQAGIANGDRLISVDGRGAVSFIQRHRLRPATELPGAIEIERAGVRRTIRLQD